MKRFAEVAFVDIKPDMTEWVGKIVEWENDRSIRHLIRPSNSESEFESSTIIASEIEQRLDNYAKSQKRFFWGLLADNQPAGTLAAEIDCPQLYNPEPGTIWPGLVIGEAGLRRRGVGRQAMVWLEKVAREQNCRRIELGVFEYNEPARALYSSLGYREFAYMPEFTWWRRQLWTDIRMEKWL